MLGLSAWECCLCLICLVYSFDQLFECEVKKVVSSGIQGLNPFDFRSVDWRKIEIELVSEQTCFCHVQIIEIEGQIIIYCKELKPMIHIYIFLQILIHFMTDSNRPKYSDYPSVPYSNPSSFSGSSSGNSSSHYGSSSSSYPYSSSSSPSGNYSSSSFNSQYSSSNTNFNNSSFNSDYSNSSSNQQPFNSSRNQNNFQNTPSAFNIEYILNKIEEAKGPQAAGVLSKKTIQYILFASKDHKEIFGSDAENVQEIGKKIIREQSYIYMPAAILSFANSFMLQRRFPTAQTGYWRLKKFGKLFGVYTVSMMVLTPLLYRVFQSNELGNQARAALVRHSNIINSPDFQKYLGLGVIRPNDQN